MKNIKYFAMMVLAVGIFAACEPVLLDGPDPCAPVSTTELANGLSFTQYFDPECTTPIPDGNYIKYESKAGIVSVYTLKSDGSENILTSGAAGMFPLIPKRGQDPNQEVHFRLANQDGSIIETSTFLTVYVPLELAPEMKLMVSDGGTKTWMWDDGAPDGVVWGNMGYCGGAGSAVGLRGEGKWWGVTSEEEFLEQMAHSDTGVATGEESFNAKMIMNEDGDIICYNGAGNIVRKGAFTVDEFVEDPEAWRQGWLNTTAGAILWPFEINSGGNKPTQFEIVYLTPAKLCLVYPDGGAFDSLGGWGEATFWHFKSNTDIPGILAGYGAGNSWTWDEEAPDGVVWGNMGYCGGEGSKVGTGGEGKWWGVTSEEEFLQQMAHSDTGVATGEESFDAYMTFYPDGSIKKFGPNGTQIGGGGEFSVDVVEGNEWKIADLNTTPGSILWPFEINSGGNKPSVFELVYLTGDKMCLVYPDGGAFDALGGWGEATFWHFKRK